MRDNLWSGKVLTFQCLRGDQGAVRPHPHAGGSSQLHLEPLPSSQSSQPGGVAAGLELRWSVLCQGEQLGVGGGVFLHFLVEDVISDDDSISVCLRRCL